MNSTAGQSPLAPHEDALASARAAVIQVLTSTAEQRDQILSEATSERDGILAGARTEATGIVDRAHLSASQTREAAQTEAAEIRSRATAEAEVAVDDARNAAEAILADSRSTAERIRGDAAAAAERMRADAKAEADAIRAGAVAVIDDIRLALSNIRGVDARLEEVAAGAGDIPIVDSTVSTEDEVAPTDHGAVAEVPVVDAPEAPSAPVVDLPPPAPETVVTDPDVADEPEPEPARELTSEEFGAFMTELANHLDSLDRARSTGDRDEVGRVLGELGDLAERSGADDLARSARALGPDARPDELDELIGQCYRMRQG